MNKVYIAGKITGLKNYKEKFNEAANKLEEQGYKVMNPSILPEGFDWKDYMKICISMIDVCDQICLLDNWEKSPGARKEKIYAEAVGKKIFYFKTLEKEEKDNLECLCHTCKHFDYDFYMDISCTASKSDHKTIQGIGVVQCEKFERRK